MMFLAMNSPLAPTGWEVGISIISLLYLIICLALPVFGVVVMLTWHRKNKLRIIELEFEERALDQRRARQGAGTTQED